MLRLEFGHGNHNSECRALRSCSSSSVGHNHRNNTNLYHHDRLIILLISLLLLCNYAAPFISSSFSYTISDQEHVIEQVKAWKYKQRSFIRVIEGDVYQERKRMIDTREKPRAVDVVDAIGDAKANSERVNIVSPVLGNMSQSSWDTLVRVVSRELELEHILTLGRNTIFDLGEKCATGINNFTEYVYGEEMFFRGKHFNISRDQYSTFETGKPGDFVRNSTTARITNRISAGSKHVLVLMPNGKVYSTGVYLNGNLGRRMTDSKIVYNAPVENLKGHKILQIESSMNSNLILTDKGLYGFGENTNSQMATGGTKPVLTPTRINGFNFNTTIVQIAMGYSFSFAVDITGKLWAWGDNLAGQLGDRTWDEKNRPFAVYRYGALLNQTIYRVCGGWKHALMLTTNGSLYAMGDNSLGQLGTNSNVNTGEPVKVKMDNFGYRTIVDIQCGYAHNLALTSSGEVFSWGYNEHGQIGDGTTTNVLKPKLVPGLSDCNVKKIHTKANVNIVLCSNNTIFAWGKNDVNQTGTGLSTSTVSVPTRIDYTQQPIVDMTSSENYSFLFLADGSIHAVGLCNNVPYFYGHECLDSQPALLPGAMPNDPKRYVFSLDGKFTKVRLQDSMTIPWYQRKPVYFEMGEDGYLLKPEVTVPTRSWNGFNMYSTNVTNTNNWTILEYNNSTNEGFPVSIYNSHFLKLNEYMYLFGGFINDEISNSIYRCPIYTLSQEWELVNVTLPIPLASGSIQIIGDFVYIFGGMSRLYYYNETWDEGPTLAPIIVDTILRAPLSNVLAFEIVRGKNISTPLHSAYSEIVGDYVYLFGGFNELHQSTFNIFRAPISDPTTWQMTFGLLPFYSINTGTFVSTNNSLYIFNGGNSSTASGGPFMAVASTNDPVESWMLYNDPVLTTESWCKKYRLLCLFCNGVQATHPSVCSSGGVCADYDTCVCSPGRSGRNCEFVSILAFENNRRYADGTYARSCEEYKNPFNTSRLYSGYTGNGFYMIQPYPEMPPVLQFCDMTPTLPSFTHHPEMVSMQTKANELQTYYRLLKYSNSITSLGDGLYKLRYDPSRVSLFTNNQVPDNRVSPQLQILCNVPYTGAPLLCSYAGACANSKCICGTERYGTDCRKVGIVLYGGYRRYADLTFAASCYYYRFPSNSSRLYSGEIGDGMYLIQPDSTKDAIPVFCDMSSKDSSGNDNSGWTLVYKYPKRVSDDAYTIWTSTSDTVGTPNKFSTDIYHLASVKNSWNIFTEARVEITSEGSVKRYIVFGLGSDKNLWFTKDSVKHSNWGLHLGYYDTYQYFAAIGDTVNNRRWTVIKSYYNCDYDLGWLIIARATDTCVVSGRWKSEPYGHSIYYSNVDTTMYFKDMLLADTVIVMLR
ncbi:hypothetical protein C9374_009311 [Naegleria lovaniensis]|uniref:EGF-like domain-containing protein n=1 Tax=Naegleria lovaniensis TaxID=51637 RepID=A0AA88GHU6_NAELO|nr:uncharacterized protein C9374_009311 [Naegleria lovaniensis]KAG2377400.1 hypothetical protein C9374_009311 [Naegleria lovaniensis]